ncbi:unnamed protein product, partial [Allacma fusca]
MYLRFLLGVGLFFASPGVIESFEGIRHGDVEVFQHADFKGVELILQRDPERCINFHRSNISNFNDYITSVKLNGNCLDVYSGVGCVGQHHVLNSSSDCLSNLVKCEWNDRISSLKFCATILPEVYQKPKGSQGDLCIDSCENNGKHYFSCRLSNGSKDYCSPRPGMDYFGNAHNQDLSSDIQKYNSIPVFYEHEEYAGKYLETNYMENRNQCYNFRYRNDSLTDFDNMASSVDVKQHCIYLYEHIGCTGNRLELSPQLNVGCQEILKNCSWSDVTTSFSFCDATFPPKYANPIGSHGVPCATSCEAQGMPYFWCGIQNGDWDYCSPRPGTDFLGNDCGDHCSYNETKFPQLAVLFEGRWHEKKAYTISSHDGKNCTNLRTTSDYTSPIAKIISSMNLKGTCLYLYENIGCTGDRIRRTSEDNATCLYELGLKGCSGEVTVASVMFCNVKSQPLNSRRFFHGFATRRQKAILYAGINFHGKYLTVDSAANSQCLNMGNNDDLTFNFYQMIYSIDLNSSSPITCLLLYDNVGCTGNFITISNWDNTGCHHNLHNCDWGNKVASVSFCNVRLPPKILEPKGLQGDICKDACDTRGDMYFSCHLQNGSRSLCSPRPGQNHLGDFCGDKCSNGGMVLHQKAILYVKKGIQDEHVTIDSTSGRQCFNLGYDAKSAFNFNDAISSITFNTVTCIRLYDSIGCVENFLELSLLKNRNCSRNLANCDWDEKISSVSFCDTQFLPNYNESIKSIHGYTCDSSCDANGRSGTYFWCNTTSSDWDFCYPRPGVNFFGEDWVPESTPDYNDHTQKAVLYDQKHFKGNQVTISSAETIRCINLEQINSTAHFNKKLTSIDLKGSCLQLFESIGCQGDFLEVYPEDGDNCQMDLSDCAWNERVSSISFCDTYFPPKYEQPIRLKGDQCVDDCDTRGKSHFWCHLKNGAIDFCLPRPGQDVLGNDCEKNCLTA